MDYSTNRLFDAMAPDIRVPFITLKQELILSKPDH